jgi:hypothetical protein
MGSPACPSRSAGLPLDAHCATVRRPRAIAIEPFHFLFNKVLGGGLGERARQHRSRPFRRGHGVRWMFYVEQQTLT